MSSVGTFNIGKLNIEDLEESLTSRLNGASDSHIGCEIISASLMEMMRCKNDMYGSYDDSGLLNDKIIQHYHEGIGRKANRLPAIIKRVIENNDDSIAKEQLLDTIADIASYAILSMNSYGRELK